MADYQQEWKELLRLAEYYVKELTAVWIRTFNHETCKDNLRRLYEYQKNHYEDLVSESLQKKSYIEDEIAELRAEAEDLKRLLKTEVQLPDITDGNNMPLSDLQNEMDKSLSDLREQLRKRREQICDLLLEQETLCEELGETTRPLLADPLPTADELTEFRSYLDSLKEERVKRTQHLMDLRREIKRDLQILELNVNTEADDRLLNHRQIKLSNETFDSLKKMREHFAGQVEELKARIDDIRQKLPDLWERLNTKYEERRKIERYTEYTQTVYDILYMELERCKDIIRQNLKQYIQKVRLEIEIWWDKTLKSEVQRSRFSNFNSQTFTDELLNLHEMELEDLKQYYETNRQIFQLYDDRKVLWERMIALEQKACDPARYNNRGGQLLKEEKERKTIASKLPKIEQQIKELVLEYQEREHEPFLVYGENILHVMEAEWKKKREDKEAHSTARKNAITPQNQGPNRSQLTSGTRTPLVQRTASTVTLCKTPSSTNLSTTKRANLLGSTAQKRKLNPSEKTTPNAKRSLWNSSGTLFLKPTGTVGSTTKTNALKAANTTGGRKKAARVIATTIRRRSGRLSSNGSILKNRKSLNRSGRRNNIASNKHTEPQIIVTEPCSTDDENYDVFRQCIEPDSRSSIRHDSTLLNMNRKMSLAQSRRQQSKLSAMEEKQNKLREAKLPNPAMLRTPSKQSLRDFPISPGAGTSSVLGSKRKLTTKNLPIII